MTELDPLLRFNKAEIMVSTGAAISSKACYNSKLTGCGRIQFLAVVELRPSSATRDHLPFSITWPFP